MKEIGYAALGALIALIVYDKFVKALVA